jgi:hypothetical protein
MSRICRLLTSISRARSLIRTLLIRLFSIFCFPKPLVAHRTSWHWPLLLLPLLPDLPEEMRRILRAALFRLVFIRCCVLCFNSFPQRLLVA